jgi:hypothetical protein
MRTLFAALAALSALSAARAARVPGSPFPVIGTGGLNASSTLFPVLTAG